MTADIPAADAPAPTRRQKIAAIALGIVIALWAIAVYAVASLLSALGGGGNDNSVGYAMAAALVIAMPVIILTTQGPRAVGIAWAVFVGLAILFVPFCGFLMT